MGAAIRLPLLLPVRFQPHATIPRSTPVLQRVVRYVERLEGWPTQVLFGRPDLVDAERCAVRLGGVLLVRTPPGDVRPDDDERWPIGDALRGRDRTVERPQIVAIGNPLDMPAVAFEPLRGIV